jgi:hypothetical protein
MLKLSEINDSIIVKHTDYELNKQKELFTELISESLSNIQVLQKDLFEELIKDDSLKIQLVNSVLEKLAINI